MVKSFLSEHTAEYCLTYNLCRILRDLYEVTPLYFWCSREGSRIAQECDCGQLLRVLAMYARRPKILRPRDESITIKVNSSLFNRAGYLSENGIPTICAVPRISAIHDFRIDTPCSCFRILPQGLTHSDVEFKLILHENRVLGGLPDGLIGPVEAADILDLIGKEAKAVTLQDAIMIFKRRDGEGPGPPPSFLWFGQNYKPVYFLLTERRSSEGNRR